jgi:hypothetical protein
MISHPPIPDRHVTPECSFEKQAQAHLTGNSVEFFFTEAYGGSELRMKAARDLVPIQAIPGLDMLSDCIKSNAKRI